MLYSGLVLLSLLCIAGIQYFAMSEKVIEKLVVLSVIYYFMVYVVVSGLLFWTGFYSIFIAVFLTFLIIFMLLLFLIYIKKINILNISVQCETQISYLSFMVIFVMLLFNRGNFEFFGMGQDQGVYQTEAINLYYGISMNDMIVDEYDELWDEDYKNDYEDFLHKLGGYDLLSYSTYVPGVEEDHIQSDAEGDWHGIPTYPGILGLSARLFGISDMQMAGTLFYVCFLCMIEFILLRHKVKPVIRALCILLAGLSPEIVWVKKSTLTEGFIAVLVVTYLYFLTSDTKKELKMSVFPVITFSYFHVTIFTMMPVFIINYWILYMRSKNRNYLRCVQLAVFGYLTGFFMMWSVSPRYTMLNYQNGMFFLPLNGIPVTVTAVCVLVWVITEVILKCNFQIPVSDHFLKMVMKYSCLSGLGLICVRAFMKQNDGYGYVMLTIVCYSVLSGIVILPAVMMKICSKKFEINNSIFVLLSMFVWCIILYSAVMRLEIPYYYYYGRYLMPYVSIILILFAMLLKNNHFQAACFILGSIILFPYANTLRVQQDDSRMEWEVLEEVIHAADEPDCVLVDKDVSKMLYFPLKAATGAKVYPVMEVLDETLEYIPAKNKSRCIYISKNEIENENQWVKLLYRNQSEFQEEDHNSISSLTGLPESIDYKGEYGVSVYQLENETEYIDSSSDKAFVSGWSGQNLSGFRWTVGNKAVLKCFLHKEDYRMLIRNGDIIPFGQISKEKIRVRVYVNQSYLGMMDFTEDNCRLDHEIVIPKTNMNDGYNEITFQCDTWSPDEYGNSDKSRYGFSVSNIQFMKNGTTTIDARSEASFGNGWSEINDAGFRWMQDQNTSLTCDLEKRDYLMQIQCGDIIPFGQISETEIKVRVFVNGVPVGELVYNQENMFAPQQVMMKKELLRDGENEVSFQYNTWSPGEYGSQNKSNYGISIKSISFKEEGI